MFQIRDDLAVSAQTQLDATARDLVERFQGAGIDGTLASGDAGLFTDNGNAFSAADETGLSARLSINAAADPDQGGATWRLRDGLGAIAPGAVGNAQLLQAMGGVLQAGRSPATGTFGAALQSASALQATFISQISADRDANDQLVSFATARYATANAGLLADGVDSDQEMQQMMLIEQAYAANARMMQAVDDMMKTLTGL
ncbi:flagellar basal body rod C-terminal domain-containing protein [Aquicoccus sp. G2-2]|uniref:flagellar basal body rod C-terminal domain-containing protein n=1 Tax=Aquicoccus sp. G2-2 TaxID=3092120 RepID=UPI002ADFEC9E|nr:flagellar basal body rod C-terminal domain-containing protein [Aquicoccus sp. G2-2]MEA1114381.1 flagellar basal body rod C-terminal domain-containing protein [Aquicoccus sp. G2-2]